MDIEAQAWPWSRGGTPGWGVPWWEHQEGQKWGTKKPPLQMLRSWDVELPKDRVGHSGAQLREVWEVEGVWSMEMVCPGPGVLGGTKLWRCPQTVLGRVPQGQFPPGLPGSRSSSSRTTYPSSSQAGARAVLVLSPSLKGRDGWCAIGRGWLSHRQ